MKVYVLITTEHLPNGYTIDIIRGVFETNQLAQQYLEQIEGHDKMSWCIQGRPLISALPSK